MKKAKWVQVLLEIAAWILYFTLPQLMRPDPMPHGTTHPDVGHLPPLDSGFWLYYSILQNLLLIPIFYLNVYWIFPGLLSRRRYLLLVIAQIVGFVLLYGFNMLVSQLLLPDGPLRPRLFMALTSYVLIFAVSYGVCAYRESQRLKAMQKEREVETMKAELQFLRWQISPHFLFNALNNLVAMARKKSDNLEPMLIHLSELLRYMIYETDNKRVGLQTESDYLQSYIHLQSIRSNGIELDVRINIPEHTNLQIEPMLLIAFVENAFKHGIDGIDAPFIKVDLSVVGNVLHFIVVNKFRNGSTVNKDHAHGVGLANVQRRLNLLYAGRHALVTSIDSLHSIHLQIELL
jgi:two-component system LytT family sensor kinase